MGDFFLEEDVEGIKRGMGKRVYIWGRVSYEDVFEDQRHTDFAHGIFWLSLLHGREPVSGHYADRHNDAT